MPKNTEILGVMFLLLLLRKEQNLNQLHKIAQLINNIDHISKIALNPQILSAFSSLENLNPLLSSLSGDHNVEEYDDENRNAIF